MTTRCFVHWVWCRRVLSPLIAWLVGVSSAAGQQIEISGSIGATPYADHHSIAYLLAGPPLPSSLITFNTSDPIDVTTDGGVVFGAGVAWFVHPNISIEGRIDSVSLHADNTPLVFRTAVSLPGNLPGTTQDVTVGPAQLSYHHPLIMSVGPRVRQTIGRVAWIAGGGLSYFKGSELVATNPVSVGSLALNGRLLPLPFQLSVAEVEIRGRTPSRLGGHVTAGLEIPLGSHLQLRPEMRYIALQTMRVDWTDVTSRTPLGPTGAIVGEPLTGLTPLELRSDFTLFQMAVVVRF